jgi:hypothetical protein
MTQTQDTFVSLLFSYGCIMRPHSQSAQGMYSLSQRPHSTSTSYNPYESVVSPRSVILPSSSNSNAIRGHTQDGYNTSSSAGQMDPRYYVPRQATQATQRDSSMRGTDETESYRQSYTNINRNSIQSSLTSDYQMQRARSSLMDGRYGEMDGRDGQGQPLRQMTSHASPVTHHHTNVSHSSTTSTPTKYPQSPSSYASSQQQFHSQESAYSSSVYSYALQQHTSSPDTRNKINLSASSTPTRIMNEGSRMELKSSEITRPPESRPPPLLDLQTDVRAMPPAPASGGKTPKNLEAEAYKPVQPAEILPAAPSISTPTRSESMNAFR